MNILTAGVATSGSYTIKYGFETIFDYDEANELSNSKNFSNENIITNNCNQFCGTTSNAINNIIAGVKNDVASHGVAYHSDVRNVAIADSLFDHSFLVPTIDTDDNPRYDNARITAEELNDGSTFNQIYLAENLTHAIISLDNPKFNDYHNGEGADIININATSREDFECRIRDCGFALSIYYGSNYEDNAWLYFPKQQALGDYSMSLYAEFVENHDKIFVLGTGDQGYNTETGEYLVYNSSDATSPFSYVAESQPYLPSEVANLPAIENLASRYSRLAAEDDRLLGGWLAVTAVDEDNVILSKANGCGDAKSFCLSAPGYYDNNFIQQYEAGYAYNNDTLAVEITRNTTIASAYVTGAVALLKEAFPNLTNSEITNIMLISATDLGAEGVDAVYGHGMLNIGAALEPIGTLNVQTNSVRLDVDATGTSLALASSFGGDIGAGFTIGAVDDYNRHYDVAVQNSISQISQL